jgi:chemotaxis protein CheZ
MPNTAAASSAKLSVKRSLKAIRAGRSVRSADPFGVYDPEQLKLSNPSEELVQLLDGFFRQVDQRSTTEFEAIARDIAEMRSELQRLGVNRMGEDLPALDAELDAITRDTENATNTILGAAEAIIALGACDPDIKSKAENLVVQIFEACSFQDLVGQRVSKVVRVLNQIEQRVARLAALSADAEGAADADAAEQRRRDLILNGPAIGGPETTQAQVDAFFD